MNIPTYKEVMVPAPIGFRPVAYHRVAFEEVMAKAVTERSAHFGITEAFDTLTGQRVAVLGLIVGQDEESYTFLPYAILHNGDLNKRLIQCCAGDGVTPEEWDLLPAYIPQQEN